MTLAERITALAEAIAADIKALYESAGGGASLPPGTVVGQVLKWAGTEWLPGTDETSNTAGRMMIPIMAGSMQPSASGGSGAFPKEPDVTRLKREGLRRAPRLWRPGS